MHDAIIGVVAVLGWELYKAFKREWVKQTEKAKGLYWKCPDCDFRVRTSEAKLTTQVVVDHDMKTHHKEGNDA